MIAMGTITEAVESRSRTWVEQWLTSTSRW